MTRSQNSEAVTPIQDIDRLERELRKLRRQQLMAELRNQDQGVLDADHQDRPIAIDAHGQPMHDEDDNPIYDPIEAQADPLEVRNQAPREANPIGVGDNLNAPPHQPPNVVNALHNANVGVRQAAYVPPLRRANLNRTIADFDTPNQYPQDRAAIRVPNPPRRDYEIKPQIIGLVKQNQFHGLSTEHPMDHIDLFEEICSTTRTNGVPEDYLKCKLFPFSLADKAHRWLKSLPPGSITTWEGCKSAFLNHFYTKSRSNSLRNKLQGFQQGPVESFYEAWERFKDYERDCPHHGFSGGNLLSTFYRGLHPKFQLSLDTASNGDFTTKTVLEGRALIENLAASSSNTCTDFDRTIRSNDSDAKQITELKNMMSQLLRNQHRAVNACETIDHGNNDALQEFDEPFDQEEEVNYVGTQGFYQNRGYNNNYGNNFRNNSNLSYRNPNVENPQDQNYPQQSRPYQGRFQNNNFGGNNNFQPRPPFNSNKAPFPNVQTGPAQASQPQGNNIEKIMQEILISHQQATRDINAKVDNIYGELNGKFESLSTFVKKLETQVAQTANAVARPTGALPGKAEENPKAYCNVISTVPALTRRVAEPLVPLFDSHEDMVRMTRTMDEDEPSRYPLRRLPKVEDPGRFVFSCSITGINFPNSLCDSGANVNVMSRSIAERLGLRDVSPSNLSLVFGDSSQKIPDGLVCDLQLVVEDCIVPTDFHILEMDERTERPLILGRPFLATVGAIIDHNNKKTTFANISKKVYYPAIPTTKPQAPPYDEESMESDVDKPELRSKSISKKTRKLPSKPPEQPQISKIKIIVPPELSKESKEQIQEMIRHTKEVLLQAKVFETSAKGQLVIEAGADYQDIEGAQGVTIPRATSSQA